MTPDLTPHSLYLRARELGLNMKADGDSLVVWPSENAPADFLEVLKANKPALMTWLRGGPDYWATRPKPALDLDPDFIATYPPMDRPPRFPEPTATKGGSAAAWCHTAMQILCGEFDGADKSTVESLITGLRGFADSTCQKALSHIKHRP